MCGVAANRAQGQALPQPSVIAVRALCNPAEENRSLWFDLNGDVDIGFRRTWFYTKDLPTDHAQVFIDRDPQLEECTFPYAGYDPPQSPPYPPNFACLDYDPAASDLWAGAYDGTGRFWKIHNSAGWIDWFGTTNFFLDTFVHDRRPREFDGVTVAEDGSLYIGSDLGFHLFHIDASAQDDPIKLPSSFVVPIPRSGVEAMGDYLFISGAGEAKILLYHRLGRFPLGYFRARNETGYRNFIEDLDIRIEGQGVYLVGAPVTPETFVPNDLLQWDVTSLTTNSDSDPLPDVIDNCPSVANFDQRDTNGDGVGDTCTSATQDSDGDGWEDYRDNCPYNSNIKQADADRDGRGDACDDITQCFAAETPAELADGLVDMAIADLDNDGDGDVVTLHQKRYSGGNFGERRIDIVTVRWSGTHGSIGKFTEPASYAVANQGTGRGFVLADINQDGYCDIAVVHAETAEDTPQPKVDPGITVLFNDKNNFFGESRHIKMPYSEDENLSSGRPVRMFAIGVDDEQDTKHELVVIGVHDFPGDNQGTITVIRYDTLTDEFEVGEPIGLGDPMDGDPIEAIAMPPKLGHPARDIAILLDNNKVSIHRCTAGITPYFEAIGYSAELVNRNGDPARGRDLAYARLRASDWYDLVVIPDDAVNDIGSRVVNVLLNDRDAQTLTLGNGGSFQQLTDLDSGKLWKLITYPSYPYDGVVVLNEEVAGTPVITRFNSTGSSAGTLNVATREDLVDNTSNPANAVLALGDISRSCGRDILVGDLFTTLPQYGEPALLGLWYAQCPFDSGSRSFERQAPSLPTCGVILDVTGTNGPDLIVATALDELQSVAGKVKVFRQTPGIANRFGYEPDESYVPRVGQFEVDAQILAMKSGRFGNTPGPDVVIGFDFGGEQYIQVLRRENANEFSVRPETFVTNAGVIKALTIGDFDLDNRTDVVVLTDEPAPNLFLSRGLAIDGTLGTVEPIDQNTAYTGAGITPLYNASTSRLDLCALHLDAPAIRILHNDGSGAFGSSTDLEVPTPSGGTTPAPVAVVIGNVSGIASPYVACIDAANQRVVIFTDVGSGYSLTSATYVGNSGQNIPSGLAALDVDADGDDDLVVGFDDGNTVVILTCLRITQPFVPMVLPSGRAPRYVVAGDVDENGLPDILEVGGFDATDSHLRVIFSNCGGM